MKTTVKDRLIAYLDYKQISKTEFGRTIGVSNSYVTSIRKSIDPDKIKSIASNYPDLNIEWLLTGNGEMIEQDRLITVLHNPPYTEPTCDGVNVYDINAAANLQTIFNNKEQNVIGKLYIPNLPKCDGALYINGDSMYPLLKSGDLIVFKEINNLMEIAYGEIYLIDYSFNGDDYLVVKYINKSDKEGYVKLVSYNKHYNAKESRRMTAFLVRLIL